MEKKIQFICIVISGNQITLHQENQWPTLHMKHDLSFIEINRKFSLPLREAGDNEGEQSGFVVASSQFYTTLDANYHTLNGTIGQRKCKTRKGNLAYSLPVYQPWFSLPSESFSAHMLNICLHGFGSMRRLGWVRLCLSGVSVPKISFVYQASQ